jgi:hypothetical protein
MDRNTQSMAEPCRTKWCKILKSSAQVLFDRSGAPDTMWFLALDYLAYVHNLSANRQIKWKIPERLSGGRGRYLPYPDVLLA